MNNEIPNFLLEMSRQMHEQDNRITAEPIFQVRYKEYLVTEEGYNEHHWEIIDTEDGTTLFHSEASQDYSDVAMYLIEQHPDWIKDWSCNNMDANIELVDSEVDEDDYDRLIESINNDFDPDLDDPPDTLKKLHMQETEVVVKTCLTEADAKAFIKRKQHDYPKLYTYVASMVFCPQMIELRNWIMSLTDGNESL